MKRLTCAVLFLLTVLGSVEADDRPNFLWITCEDISPYLGSYGCAEALTPNLDKLAASGVRYTRAYSNAPVCAVARSTLLTGMYSSTLGTHQMRSYVQLPSQIPAYPKLLRQAGYYCTNNSKTDYNSSFLGDKTLWDESSSKAHFRNREAGQPFFAVFNLTVTHESNLGEEKLRGHISKGIIPHKPRVDKNDIVLPPYHPDLPEIRNDWARLHDLITAMDRQAGEILGQLDEDGLSDDTIVFFYSDHGGMLCRSKRYIYNIGTQVPLIVSFPRKWQQLAPAKPGQTVERLVSFVDFPKTVLSLAGVELPELMQGRVFLGPRAEPPESTVHLYRDRMGARYDFSRAVTDGRWYYIRNFMPHRPRGRDSRYGHLQANWRAWERHHEEGKCNETQSQFFHPKPLVQLFDTANDPWHVSNVADEKEHAERLNNLAADLEHWMVATRDTALIPEPMVADLAGPDKEFKTIYEYAQSDHYPVAELLGIAKRASSGDKQRLPEYLRLLGHGHPAARWWGAYGLFLVRDSSSNVRQPLKEMIESDPVAANRIMAAQALGLCGDPDSAYRAIRNEADETANGYVFLHALCAFQYSHTDDRLTLDDWKAFQGRRFKKIDGVDHTGPGYAKRIIDDAISIFPERRQVD